MKWEYKLGIFAGMVFFISVFFILSNSFELETFEHFNKKEMTLKEMFVTANEYVTEYSDFKNALIIYRGIYQRKYHYKYDGYFVKDIISERIAFCYYALSDFKQALDWYKKALCTSLIEKRFKIYFFKGLCEYRLKIFEEAKKSFKYVLYVPLNENYEKALFYMAEILLEENKPREAIKYYIRMKPNTTMFAQIGYCYELLKEYKKAYKFYFKAHNNIIAYQGYGFEIARVYDCIKQRTEGIVISDQ